MTLRHFLRGLSAAACLAAMPGLASAQAAVAYQDDTVAPTLNVPVTPSRPLPTYCVVFNGSTCGSGSGGDITGPLGTGTAATGVRVTLSATDAANLAAPLGVCATNPCTQVVGVVGIDQTTNGTTNKVSTAVNASASTLIQASASVPITFTAAGGPTQIIAASGSTKIYITHWDVVFSGAGTIALITGTGTNCGTGTTYLTGASGHPLSFAANGGISAGSGLGPILVTGAGGEICAITTGAVDSSGSIAYAQF